MGNSHDRKVSSNGVESYCLVMQCSGSGDVDVSNNSISHTILSLVHYYHALVVLLSRAAV